MDVRIAPGELCGSIMLPSSKSSLIRLVIMAALSDKPTEISFCGTLCADVNAGINAAGEIGADIIKEDKRLTVYPMERGAVNMSPCFDFCDSATVFRLMLPIACALSEFSSFNGSDQLKARPIKQLMDELKKHKITFSERSLPFSTRGRLEAGDYEIYSNISSQYVSAMLIALSITPGESTLKLVGEVESRTYIELTLSLLKAFGAQIFFQDKTFYITGRRYLSSPSSTVAPGDYSLGANWLSANRLGAKLILSNLPDDPALPDSSAERLLERMFRSVNEPCRIDLSQSPDLIAALSVAASFSPCGCVFTNAARLKYKESDRLFTCARLINNLGGKAGFTEDSICVEPKKLSGGCVESFNDHRIAMAAAVASVGCSDDVIIKDAQCVDKSYPDFFSVLKHVGGRINVL